MELDRDLAYKALTALDEKLARAQFAPLTLVMGGGGAMIMAYGFSGATADIDAVSAKTNFDELRPFLHDVSKDLRLDADWINPYFSAFTIYLPSDSSSRMREVFKGSVLTVTCLGPEDILLMKLMAARGKDRRHIVHLLRMTIDITVVEKRLEELKNTTFSKEADRALGILDDYLDGK
jgi:hypothetical protein